METPMIAESTMSMKYPAVKFPGRNPSAMHATIRRDPAAMYAATGMNRTAGESTVEIACIRVWGTGHQAGRCEGNGRKAAVV